MKPMTPMTMAMSSMSAFRKRKGKHCCAKDASLSTNVNCHSKNARLVREQVEQQHLFQDGVNARMVRVARRQQLSQQQAFETQVLERQQQQQAKLVDEDTEGEADTVCSSMVKPNP